MYCIFLKKIQYAVIEIDTRLVFQDDMLVEHTLLK